MMLSISAFDRETSSEIVKVAQRKGKTRHVGHDPSTRRRQLQHTTTAKPKSDVVHAARQHTSRRFTKHSRKQNDTNPERTTNQDHNRARATKRIQQIHHERNNMPSFSSTSLFCMRPLLRVTFWNSVSHSKWVCQVHRSVLAWTLHLCVSVESIRRSIFSSTRPAHRTGGERVDMNLLNADPFAWLSVHVAVPCTFVRPWLGSSP